MQPQNRSHVVFLRVQNFLVVGVRKEGEHGPLRAERRLDNVRDIFFVCGGVGIFHIFPAFRGVLLQIVVRSVGNAPQLAPAERKIVFEVCRRFGVETKLLFGVVAQFQVFLFQTQRKEEVFAVIFPVIKPFEVGVGFAEKFKLHLLELAHAENEVSGRYFVAEGFAYLTYSERHAHTRSALNVFEVDENTLRGFGTEVDGVYRIFGHTLKCLKHQVEFSYRREIAFAADGANDFFVRDKRFQSVVVHTFDFYIKLVFFAVIFRKVVGAVARFTAFAVH